MPAQQVLRIFLLLSGKTNNVVINGLKAQQSHSPGQRPTLGYVLLPLRGVLLVSFDTLAEGTFLARLVHFLLGWCISCSVGAFLARLVHLRQVHPLSVPPFAFAVQSDSVRRPIRFRSPSDRIPYG